MALLKPKICASAVGIASRSDKQQMKASKGAGNQAAKWRVAEQSFWGWVNGTHHPQEIHGSSQDLAGRKKRSTEMTRKDGMLGLDDDASELFSFKDDGTVEVCKWVSDVPLKAFRGLANACEEERFAEETVPAGTQKIPTRMRVQVSEDDAARHDFTKSIMWKSTDILRPVIGETERSRHVHFLCWFFLLVGHHQ